MAEQLQFISIADALRKRAAASADDVGYVFLVDAEAGEARLTYGELDRQARAIAVMLREANATGGRALLAYPSGLEFIAALFGCWYAGMTAVPVYPPRSLKHSVAVTTLIAIANDCQPSVVLTVSSLVPMLTAAKLGSAAVLATDRIEKRVGEEFQPVQSDVARLPAIHFRLNQRAQRRDAESRQFAEQFCDHSAVLRFGSSKSWCNLVTALPRHGPYRRNSSADVLRVSSHADDTGGISATTRPLAPGYYAIRGHNQWWAEFRIRFMR